MLTIAFILLAGAVLLGSVLAVLHLRRSGAVAPPVPLAAAHGLLAMGGLACLLLALCGPPRGLETGTASFGALAAALFALAALAGGGILASHLLKRRVAGTLIGIHATLAVSGAVILAAYLVAG
jgi:hypothetical protein